MGGVFTPTEISASTILAHESELTLEFEFEFLPELFSTSCEISVISSEFSSIVASAEDGESILGCLLFAKSVRISPFRLLLDVKH